MSDVTQAFRGQIVKIGKNRSGSYCWVGFKSLVSLPDGGQRSYLTTKDIFLHRDDSNMDFAVGMQVAFNAVPDPARRGALRAIDAIQFEPEPNHIELHVDSQTVDNPSVPVRWCFTREMHAQMVAGLKVGKAYAILMVARHQDDDRGFREQREIKSPFDLFSFVTFTRPGMWDLGMVLYEMDGVTAGQNPRTVLVRAITSEYLSKTNSGRTYIEPIPNLDCNGLAPHYPLYGLRIYHGHATAKVVAVHQISIDLPREIFAREPSQATKAFANRFYRQQPYDECELRRRLIVMSFVGWLPWLIVEFFNRTRQFLGGLFQLLTALRGSVHNIGHAFTPAIRFQLNLSLPERGEDDSDEALFYPPWNRPFTQFLNPLFVVVGGSLIRWVMYPLGRWLVNVIIGLWTYATHATYSVSEGSGLSWQLFAGVLVGSVIGTILYRRFLRKPAPLSAAEIKAARTLESEARAEEQKRLRQITISAMSDEAAKAARIAPAVVCGGDVPHQVSLSAIPAELQTFRLRFSAFKRTVCRPFA